MNDMKIKIGRFKDPLSERDGMWYVAIPVKGKYRIVFTDVYRKVCVEYVKNMRKENKNEY